MNSTNPAEYEAYLAQFPNGVFRTLAEARLAALRLPTGRSSGPAAVARTGGTGTPASSSGASGEPAGVATTAGTRPQPGDAFRDCDVCPEMVVMPGGRLALGRHEVTVGEYAAFAAASGGGAGGGCYSAAHRVPRYLHLELVRAAAMIELLTSGWCEAAAPNALHLSTLTHQVLALLAECGRMPVGRLYTVLCRQGPFRSVSPARFGTVLRRLAEPDVALVEPAAAKREVKLGAGGEKLVGRRDFYAAFNTSDEYHLVIKGRPLGTLPRAVPLMPRTPIIFSGRTWEIESVDEERHVVEVRPADSGNIPKFAGVSGGGTDEAIVEKMAALLGGDGRPGYLDADGRRLLDRARQTYRHFDLARRPVMRPKDGNQLVMTGAGTATNLALKVLLEREGWRVYEWPGFINATAPAGMRPSLAGALGRAAETRLPAGDLLRNHGNLQFEKCHEALGASLVGEDLASSRLDFDGARRGAARLTEAAAAAEGRGRSDT